MSRKFGPKVPRVLVQSWITMDQYSEIEKMCLEKNWSLSHMVREGMSLVTKKHAEEKEAA
jgi:hypothetical protein